MGAGWIRVENEELTGSPPARGELRSEARLYSAGSVATGGLLSRAWDNQECARCNAHGRPHAACRVPGGAVRTTELR